LLYITREKNQKTFVSIDAFIFYQNDDDYNHTQMLKIDSKSAYYVFQ